MESQDTPWPPAKRLRSDATPDPSPFNSNANFIPLGGGQSMQQQHLPQRPYWNQQYTLADWQSTYDRSNRHAPLHNPHSQAHNQHGRTQHQQSKFERLNAKDRPKSKHVLAGVAPWVLVKTKLGRRFVHNEQSRVSLWRIPRDLAQAVTFFDEQEKLQKEKEENAQWAEEEFEKMRETSGAEAINTAADVEGRARRRRSESLQREDEEALLAELAAQEQAGEERDPQEAVKQVEKTQASGYETDSSYEEVEVTDSEAEDEEPRTVDAGAVDDVARAGEQVVGEEGEAEDSRPVEFGEDDIAYQLAAMGEEYGIDLKDDGDIENYYDDDYDEFQALMELKDTEAVELFREMLSDRGISPFVPWENLISDISDAGIVHDDRYTVLRSTKARKEAFTTWAKEAAAKLNEERDKMEKLDPKIPYLEFLAEKATPKLYWAEFKRKYAREAVMKDRKLQDKEREKLYRDHINRLKLPESSRKADLQKLLESVPLPSASTGISVEALPQQLRSHLHFISLSASKRDSIIEKHMASLPAAAANHKAASKGVSR